MESDKNPTESSAVVTLQVDRKTLKVLIVGVAVIGAFSMPPYLVDKVIGIATFPTAARTCFRFWKDVLKDPWSAYLIDSRAIKSSDSYTVASYPVLGQTGEAVQIEVKSKNSFGAYGTDFFYCPTTHGMTSYHETEEWYLHR